MNQLDTPAQEKGIGVDEKRIGPLAREGIEGRIDLAARTGLENLNLQAHGARSRCQCLHVDSAVVTLAGLQARQHELLRDHLAQEFQPLEVNSPAKKLTPVRLPPGGRGCRQGQA